MKDFPDCFPPDFVKRLLPKEAKEQNLDVYRVIKNGQLNRESFLSTYEETIRHLRPFSANDDKDDPSYYSTSCDLNAKQLEYFLKLTLKREPKAFIAKGTTNGSCGPSQITSERQNQKKSTHVDWWIYKDAEPQVFFKEV